MLNNIELKAVSVEQASYSGADSIVVMMCKECMHALELLQLPEAVKDVIKAFVAKKDDIYSAGSIERMTMLVDGKLQNILFVGCGEGKDCKPNNFRKAAGNVVRELHKLKSENAALVAAITLNPKRDYYLNAIAEGLFLGAYTFTEYKSKKDDAPICSINVLSAIQNADAVLQNAEIAAEAVSFSRDLANHPGNVINPLTMVTKATEVAKSLGLEIEVLDEKDMAAKGMNSLLAVGQGSEIPPRLITLKYNGAGDAPYVAYVGKGITFDSGGISIKPGDGMGEMKDDMSGSAAVLGAIKAIAGLKLKCNIIAVLACAENMPSGKAQRPGDIVRAANGKTIEVVNTDAEGRMVLADAVWYACEQGATKVIDIATLTGAVIIALGNETSGIVANNDELVKQIMEAGKQSGENYWQLPSLPECKEAIKSDVADLLNSAGRAGGCITGGLFVGEFVKEGTPWAHIDIGGTSTSEKTSGHKVKGCTAFGTMTLIKLAEALQ